MNKYYLTGFFSLLLLPALSYAAEEVTLGDCKISVPPGAKSRPTQSWYDAFKKGYGGDQASARDTDRWRAKERNDFDTCAAFKLMMGICWKESGLNPAAGPGADKIPSPGLCQIQKRNCDGVGVRGNLNNAETNLECAAKLMKKKMGEHGAITQGFDQRGNGRGLTMWSVMICNSKNKVGHREEIRGYQQQGSGKGSCQ